MDKDYRTHWRHFTETVEIRGQRDKACSSAAIVKQIPQFEKEWNFRLPDSYKAFMEEFGPVSVAGGYQIMPPVGKKEFSDIASYNTSVRKFVKDNLSDMRKCKKWYPQLMRVIIFGSDYCGDNYAWDPLEVTNHTTCEYGVYYVVRESERWPPKKIADNFQEFIEEFLLGGGLATLDADLEPLERYFTCA